MQPDANDIVYRGFGINADTFRSFLDLLTGSNVTFASIGHTALVLWTIYSILAFIVSAIFVYGIIYSYIRLGQLEEEQEEDLHEQEKMWRELHDGSIENERWLNVQRHLESENPNDWKLAIIEADVLLERLLEKAGYAGTTIADRLRSASARSFSTIDDAWQAHRVRNQIAHGGSDFVLTQKTAKDTLILYERVFKEFDMI